MKIFNIMIIVLVLFFTSLACSSATSTGNSVSVNEEESVGDISPTTENENVDSADSLSEGESNQAEILEETEITSTPTPENEVKVEEQVLFDQDGVIITLKELTVKGLLGPSLKLLIENNSTKNITVQSRDFNINDVMIDPIFSSNVAAGKKANDEITFMESDLIEANIMVIKTIELKLVILDADTYADITKSETIKITTDADPSYVQTFDDSGFVALDKNDLRIVFQKLDSEDSFWGADIYAYIENNSPNDITVQLRDVSINGFMVDPLFSSDVLSGKKAFDTVTFFESDLTDNGISSIDELAAVFYVFNMDTWSTIFESEIITISFSE